MARGGKHDPRLAINEMLRRPFTPESKQAEFEDSVIKQVLKRCGGSALIGPLQGQAYETTGKRLLTAAQFNDSVRGCPVHLYANALPGVKLHVDPKALWYKWFSAFLYVPFVPIFRDVLTEHKRQKREVPAVLVFPRKSIPLGLCVHAGLPGVPSRLGGHFEYEAEDFGPWYVEPWANVLAALYRSGRGWRPAL